MSAGEPQGSIVVDDDDRSDAELITAVRAGDTASYGLLFERHRAAAYRLARQLMPGSDADDLVSEAFTKVLVRLQAGSGPDIAFRAYLLTAVRRLHIDRVRDTTRTRATDDDADLDQPVAFYDRAEATFEAGTAAEAFASLPERWQAVLWHLDVEGAKPADVAPLLGMSANSVSALAYRAREGLRQAYLQHHLADAGDGDHRWTTEHLGAHVRKGLSARDTVKIEAHLDECARCMGIYLELSDVNADLAGVLGPALLGGAAAAYLAGGVATGTAAAAGGAVGLKAVLGAVGKAVVEPIKAVATTIGGAGVQGVAAATVVAGLGTAGVYAATTTFHDDSSSSVQRATPTATTAPSTTPTTEAPTTTTPSTPTPTPSVAPTTEVPLVVPTTDAPTSETTTDAPTEPPAPPPPAPTDLGVGPVSVVDNRFITQRTITVPVTASTDGDGKDLTVSLHLTFPKGVRVHSLISKQWDCPGVPLNRRITSATCSVDVPANASAPALVFTTRVYRPAGTVTVSASGNDDPASGNDSTTFTARPWRLHL